jgi:hypothetical protein
MPRCVARAPALCFLIRLKARARAAPDTERMPCRLTTLVLMMACALGAGCAQLLPAASSDASSSFATYEEAQSAFERIVPYKTSASELRQIGFDTGATLNVRVIPYPDLVSRLAPNSGIPLTELDPGIRDCILARMGCLAYEFHVGRETRVREGSFVLDFLNFKRTTVVKGWKFDALVVVRDGMVLFRNGGGEPHADRTERQTNPLGPLQSSGDALYGIFK